VLEALVDKFSIIRRKVIGYGRITKTELEGIFKDIRITLLEADVNYRVVKEFIERLGRTCEGLELAKTLTPGDLVLKAVYEELVVLLGATPHYIDFSKTGLIVISLVGLQGVGKTTTAAKIALKYKGRNPLLVPADAKRPAAVQQLTLLAERAKIPLLPLQDENVLTTVKTACALARERGHGLVVIDTAGRLQIDDELIQELIDIHHAVKPQYRLLVADGMTGQDAVNQALTFHENIGLEGAILTKMDGDARGGAALSITQSAHIPIYFIGTSEYLEGLEEFAPDRIAQRIMGMGDIGGLVDKIKTMEQQVYQQRLRSKMAKGDLNFEDFLEQVRAMKKLGPLSKLAAMIPGVKETDIDEKDMVKVEAIVNSMTRKERLNPALIDGSRKRRIAEGSGTTMHDVNQLLKQFYATREMLKKMGKGKMPGNLPFTTP
jgi:signal recognition particle subunit SRP54